VKAPLSQGGRRFERAGNVRLRRASPSRLGKMCGEKNHLKRKKWKGELGLQLAKGRERG